MNDGNGTSKLETGDSGDAVAKATQTGLNDSAHGEAAEAAGEPVDEESGTQAVEETLPTTHKNEFEKMTLAPSQLVPEEGFQGEESVPRAGTADAETVDNREDDESESAPRVELFFTWGEGGKLQTDILDIATGKRSVYRETFIRPSDESSDDFCARVAKMIEAELAVPVSYHVPEDADGSNIDNETMNLSPVVSNTPNTETKATDAQPEETSSVDAHKNEASSASATTEATGAKKETQSNDGNVSISINKKLLIGVGIGIVAVLALVGIIIAVSNSNKEKAATDEFNSYVAKLKSTELEMLSSGATAESIGNDVKRVWNAAIFEKYKSGWDTDIKKYYDKDFNTAIAKYYKDNSSKISSLENDKDDVAESMRKLASPPDGCETAYATITDLYDEYNTLVSLAISPTGSLQTYSESFNAADTGFVNTMNKLDTQIPEQKK